MSYSIENYSKDFEKTNHEFRAYWQMGREAARNVAIKLNKLVSILYKEHPDWSIKQIAYTIWSANGDLEGFSKNTIYRNLDDDNRALLHVTKPTGGATGEGTNSQNNVLEESDYERNQNVLEDSSSRTLPTAYDVKEAEVSSTTPHDDDNAEDDDVLKVPEQPFQFPALLAIKDQEIPIIVTVFPNKQTGYAEVDEKLAKKMKR